MNDYPLKPGDTASITGLYRVRHHQHRYLHVLFIPAGTILPQCHHCGQRVRFEFMDVAPASLDSDKDFCITPKAAGQTAPKPLPSFRSSRA
jgi:hypothetical protein